MVPERVRVPVPILVRATRPDPAPELLRRVPEKEDVAFPEPMVRVEVPVAWFWTVPLLVSPPMVSLKLLRSRVPAELSVTICESVTT